MIRLNTETLESYLNTYGWEYQLGRAQAFLTGWQGEKRSYPLTIRLTDTWIMLQVAPLMKLSVEWEASPELSRYLLELNHDCQMVKVSIDSDAQIVLSLQLFNIDCSYEQFSDAIGVIGHYAEFLYDEISGRLQDLGYISPPPLRLLT